MRCSPLAVRVFEPVGMVMAGELTVTSRDASPVEIKPGIEPEIVVVPVPSGSKAAPPAATVVGEEYCPTAIWAVTDCAAIVPSRSWPTDPESLVNVTVRGPGAPARTASTGDA